MIKLYCAILNIDAKNNAEKLYRIETFINYLRHLKGAETAYICSKYTFKWKEVSDVDTSIDELKKYETITLAIGLLEGLQGDHNELDFSQCIGLRIDIYGSPSVYISNGSKSMSSKDCLDRHLALFDQFVDAHIIDSYKIC